MKKKLLALLLAFAMCFALASCGDSAEGGDASSAASSAPDANASSVVSEEEAETEDQPEESDTAEEDGNTEEESSVEGVGDLGSYHVEIKGAQKVEDYEGNPAILITYSWTNNSEDTTSPFGSMFAQAFQDGVELDYAIVDFEYNDGLSDVRPGTTIDVDEIFTMTSDSTVEFELSAIEDLFLDTVPMVTMDFDPTTLE